MPRSRLVALILLVLMNAAALGAQPDSAAPADWSHLTVVTETGETYRDVTVAWVGQGQGLLLTRADGASQTLSLAQIREVTDADGQSRRADLVALQYASGQPDAPAPRIVGDFTEPGTSEVTLADATDRRVWLFNWAFGIGPGLVSTAGGEFPGSGTEVILSNTIRRRIYTHHYLSLASHSMHLADQYVADWLTTDDVLVEWNESQLILSYGHYYRPRNWYWELGLGALVRTLHTEGSSGENKYLKGAVRFQIGGLIEMSRHVAVDLALFTTLKPGFEDTGGGLAADLGLRGELVVW